MTAREAHPVADLFPMLAADELAELAADIKSRGLLYPIVLDVDGRILDGRNRLTACELAGVEPRFITYGGDDSGITALAGNGQVRELTKAQKAIVGAMAILSSDSELEDQHVASALRVSKSKISEAVVIVQYARDLAEQVIAGGYAFSRALETAYERRTESESLKSKMNRLIADAEDLAELVDECRMDVDEALAALDAREEKTRQEAEAARREAAARASEEELRRREQERKQVEEQRDARALLSRVVELLAPASRTDGFVATWAAQLGELDVDLTELIKRAADAQAVLGDLIERTGR